MNLTIRNIRGIEAFDLALERGEVTRLVGENASGKTTVACCLAACLAQDPDPLRKGARRFGSYVRRGASAEMAHAALYDGKTWVSDWSAASGRFTTTGEPPRPPALAVMDPRERGREDWIRAIEGEPPTVAELAEAIEAVTGDAEGAETIAKRVLEHESWKLEADLAAERRAKAKGRWEEAVASTGERATYGVRVASGWRPRGWTPDHEGLVAETCERRLVDAGERSAAARSALATLEARIEEGREADAEKRAHQRELAQMREQLAALPETPSEPTTQGAGLQAADDALAAAQAAVEPLEAAYTKAKAEQAARAKACGTAASDLMDAKAEHERAVQEHEDRVSEAQRRVDRAARLVAARRSITEDTACKTCGQELPSELLTPDRESLAEAETREAEALTEVEELSGTSMEDPDLTALEAADRTANASLAEANRKLDRMTPDLMAARAQLNHASAEYANIRTALKLRQDTLADAERKRERLTGRIEQAESRTFASVELPEDPDLEDARLEIDKAENDRKAAEREAQWVRAKERAEAAHEEAVTWDAVAVLLGSSARGFRAKRLKAALERVRKWLRHIAPWVSIGLDDTPGLTIGGALAADGSESERWAAHAALRITIAAMRGSPACVLDGADVLTTTPRLELLDTVCRIAQRANVAVLWTESRDGAELEVM